MAVKIGQSLLQTQNLVMTPQLQQAIKLLTMTHLEMTTVIANEMVENPMLEELGTEMGPDDAKVDVDHKLEKLENQSKEAKSENFDEPGVVNKDDFDWQSYVEAYNSNSSSPPSMVKQDFDEMPNYENMVSRGMSLSEHLLWQLRMENIAENEMNLLEEIIHNINDDGYLAVDFEKIVANVDHDRDDAWELLELIKRLDPVGCGSSTLSECLLAQAQVMENRMPLVESIIRDHLDDFQKRDYGKIAKELGVEKDLVKDAEQIITSFNPKPGRLVSPEEIQYVVPDIYIKDVGGELSVYLNDEGVPRLRISNLYKSMLKGSSENNDEAKEYVEDKLRAAAWLIKSIANRQKTIVRVTEAILKYQPLFFKKGPQHLKPMILKDIANEIGVHESTVSRVTTNKFVHTPIGIFELKYFFNAGVGGKNGGIDIANESLKLKIKKLIENENKKKPLSDQKIVEILGRESIKVARRTVAKYRDVLNIPSSSKRKRIE